VAVLIKNTQTTFRQSVLLKSSAYQTFTSGKKHTNNLTVSEEISTFPRH